MLLSQYAVVGMVLVAAIGLGLLLAALFRRPHIRVEGKAWRSYRFGFATFSLIFLAFDMEMIFMYPWAVVFGEIGLKAFLDMLVFIALLSAGITYAWGMGALRWE